MLVVLMMELVSPACSLSGDHSSGPAGSEQRHGANQEGVLPGGGEPGSQDLPGPKHGASELTHG